jgi:hypothetical protein
MDYCGVAYITFESVEDSSWKWRIRTSHKGKIQIGGEAAPLAKAIEALRPDDAWQAAIESTLGFANEAN